MKLPSSAVLIPILPMSAVFLLESEARYGLSVGVSLLKDSGILSLVS